MSLNKTAVLVAVLALASGIAGSRAHACGGENDSSYTKVKVPDAGEPAQQSGDPSQPSTAKSAAQGKAQDQGQSKPQK